MSDRLDRALRDLRETETGRSPDAEQTLRRVLADQQAARRARWRQARVWLPIAATLAISTAALARWGSTTAPLPREALPVMPAPMPSTSAPSTPPEVGDLPPPRPPADGVEAPRAQPVRAATPPTTQRSVVPSSIASATEAIPAPPPPSASAVTEDSSEVEVYGRAHRLHFDGASPSAALAAWDDYLRRYPDGRFAPDARYNRAIALLKLHRYAEGRAALQPFADGDLGGYHREDARALLRDIP